MVKSRKELIGFNDTWLMIIGIPLGGLIISFMMFYEIVVEDPGMFFKFNFPIAILYTFLYWVIFRGIVINIRKRFGSIDLTWKRNIIQITTVIIVFFILESIFVKTLHPITMEFCGLQEIHTIPKMFGTFLLTFFILGIYEVVYIYQQTVNLQMEKEHLKQEKLTSQLHGLRNQIQPHFLFNSLNTLISLIPKDSDKSVKFVEKLSTVYRYLLDIHDKKLIALEEEMEYLQAYLHLMQERYPNSLHVEINVPDQYLNKLVLPLSLQLLVENAIKHNIISNQKPLRIDIGVNDQGYIHVKNNLQLKDQIMHSTKIGLENIRRRYQHLCDKPISIIKSATNFMVSIPLLTLEESHL